MGGCRKMDKREKTKEKPKKARKVISYFAEPLKILILKIKNMVRGSAKINTKKSKK